MLIQKINCYSASNTRPSTNNSPAFKSDLPVLRSTEPILWKIRRNVSCLFGQKVINILDDGSTVKMVATRKGNIRKAITTGLDGSLSVRTFSSKGTAISQKTSQLAG